MPETCEVHEKINEQLTDNAALLASIDARLRGVLWVGCAGILVYLLPVVIYAVQVEKRITMLEDSMIRISAQRNADHPTKDPFR